MNIIGKSVSYSVRAFCFLHVIHGHVYEFTETRGESMLPTLNSTNDYVHVSKRYNNGRGIEMGDCVVAIKPSDPMQRVCKRVSGMPGDIIEVDPSMSSKLNYISRVSASINLDKIDDLQEKEKIYHETIEKALNDEKCIASMNKGESFNEFVRVPKGHVWLTGDNLSYSVDSRTYNFVPLGLIKGKIVAANDFNKPILDSFRWIENIYK